MRASRTSGSVEGVLSDGHPYSDSRNEPSDKPGTVQEAGHGAESAAESLL
jgi:hypothetical protein